MHRFGDQIIYPIATYAFLFKSTYDLAIVDLKSISDNYNWLLKNILRKAYMGVYKIMSCIYLICWYQVVENKYLNAIIISLFASRDQGYFLKLLSWLSPDITLDMASHFLPSMSWNKMTVITWDMMSYYEEVLHLMERTSFTYHQINTI